LHLSVHPLETSFQGEPPENGKQPTKGLFVIPEHIKIRITNPIIQKIAVII